MFGWAAIIKLMNSAACEPYCDLDFNDLVLPPAEWFEVVRAHEAVVRLDEQVGRSSIGRAWAERILFAEACACQLGQGNLVDVAELVLLDGGVRRQPGYPELVDTHHMFRAWRGALDVGAVDLLRAHRPGLADDARFEPFPVFRRPVQLTGAMKENDPSEFHAIDSDRRDTWRRVWRGSQKLTPVLAAALVWDCWMTANPEPGAQWRATLLAALVLRAMGTTSIMLLPIDLGWRAARYRVGAGHSRHQRLMGFVSWLEAAAGECRKDLASLNGVYAQLRSRLRGCRRQSRLPALARLFVSLPLVTVPLAARHLGCSPQAINKMLPLLGSVPREVTERDRFRAWTVP